MATVLECFTEEQSAVVRILWTKGLSASGNKEVFPVYRVKRFTTWSRNVTDISDMTKR
jgi:hypothetical protein